MFGLVCFFAAIATRLAHLNTPPGYDELYHILAAQSWLENGSLAIYQGSYDRTPLYTIFTAWMFELAGNTSLAMARLPNVIFGALFAAGAAMWARGVAGSLTGWIVALLVLLWPSGIQLSQTIRFYALHGVVFFVGAIAVYEVFRPGNAPLRRLVMILLAVAALWFARQFQDSTLVGILGLAVWVAAFVALPNGLRLRHGRLLLGGAAVLVLAGIAAAVMSGTLETLWVKYTTSPWGRDVTAYHRVFSRFYPLLWPLTPILAIFALYAFPRPAGFCVTLVAVGLVVHSFSGVQNIRYIYYFSPFLFVIWAMGLQVILPMVIGPLRQAVVSLPPLFAHPRLVSAVIFFAGLFAVLAQDAVPVAVKLTRGDIEPPFVRARDWSEARAPVEQYVENGALVVATNELAAIHYLGGFDVVFSKNWIPEMNQIEFALDPRTGRPLISRIESLEKLVAVYPEGIFLASVEWWARWPTNNSVGDLMQAFEGPGVSSSMERAGPLWILHWQASGPRGEDEAAAAIRQVVDPGRWVRRETD